MISLFYYISALASIKSFDQIFYNCAANLKFSWILRKNVFFKNEDIEKYIIELLFIAFYSF
jgi:hypothetical protein